MRSLVILLSLVVFFLTGLTIGMDRTHEENDSSGDIHESAVQKEEKIIVEKNVAKGDSEGQMLKSPKNSEHFTYKIASFLESSVKGFYELVVSAAYQLVQVFF
ncbi:hypothetical protein GCM10007063_02500 [Lentibacillus kapialis]|uniref:DUF3679 domain-containing protein n=1 Tax=Lentibacillus kapialis TaxID=340214 RepID=A0A917PL19_9BACI|nr:hypothetical protein [Lentibacillus kapialis]GGJ83497.1 hypothetical protein GCM10007063_02500 [Lentibacillus kapialis]